MSDQVKEYSNDDFEKVDAESYQDENVTSTSMSGEMAEEDRYDEGSAQNDIDLLGGGGGAFTAGVSSETKPLISFDQSPPEPTAPPMESSVSGSKASAGEGNWVKNVDPRDCPSVEDMTEPNDKALPDELTEPAAQSEASLNSLSGDVVSVQSNEHLDSTETKKGNLSDSDSILSESSDYSSSGEETDSEPSDSESSEDYSKNGNSLDQNTVYSINKNIDISEKDSTKEQNIRNNTTENKNEAIMSDLNKCTPSDDLTKTCVTETTKPSEKMEEINKKTEEFEPISKVDGDSGCANDQWTSTVPSLLNEENKNSSITKTCETIYEDKTNKTTEDTDLPKETHQILPEHAETAYSPKHNEKTENVSTVVEDSFGEMDKSELDAQSSKIQSSLSYGISETELSDVLDKLTNEQDIVDNISPVVSDFEKEIEAKEGDSKESSESPKLYSEESESEDECSSVDSDLSGDEEVSGTWNPSPLYSFDIGEDDDEEEKAHSKDMCENENEIFDTEFASQEREKCTAREGDMDDDNKLLELREDVKGLMEEMESLVKQGNHYENEPRVKMPAIELDGSDIQVIGTAETITSSFKQSDKSKNKMSSNSNEQDMPHVHFQSPTNMLFYDPESPIIERISAEVQNELIDYDDEAKDVETEKENVGDATQAELQAEVVKDLKEVYEKLEANRETDGNIKDVPEFEENKAETEFAISTQTLESVSDPSKLNLYKRKQEHLQENQGEEEVVLRKKSNRDASAVLNRGQIVSENECDSMIIHDLELVHPQNEKDSLPIEEDVMKVDSSNTSLHSAACLVNRQIESENDENSEMKSSTESMIIYDDKESIFNEVEVSNLNNNTTDVEERSDELVNAEAPYSILSKDIKDTEFAEQMMESTDNKLEKYNIQDTFSDFSNTPVVDLVKENVIAEQLFEENNPNLGNKDNCNFESEMLEESSPFDVSLNDTVVEAHKVVSEDKDDNLVESSDNDVIPEKLSTKIDENKPLVDASARVTHNETVKESNESAAGQNTKELVLFVLKQVLELIYWRDVKKTGVVFGSMMFVLLSLSICSLMSVLAYLSLAILTVTLSFRVYKNVMQAVQKTNEGHPFKNLLQMDIELHEDVVKNAADKIAQNVNNCARELRRLYLVEDYVDTLKFGLLLWLMTYIGGWFNGMTLIILGVVSIFTLPKVYETYKVPIDQNVNLVRGNLNNIMAQVSAKIPFPKKKAKTQ